MKQYCYVADEYLGLKPEDCETTWDRSFKVGTPCEYYRLKFKSLSGAPICCGNCKYYIVYGGMNGTVGEQGSQLSSRQNK